MKEPELHHPVCQQLNQHLYNFIDEELDEETHKIFTSHIWVCNPCANEVHMEVHIRSVIQRSCKETAPSQLRNRILKQVKSFPE